MGLYDVLLALTCALVAVPVIVHVRDRLFHRRMRRRLAGAGNRSYPPAVLLPSEVYGVRRRREQGSAHTMTAKTDAGSLPAHEGISPRKAIASGKGGYGDFGVTPSPWLSAVHRGRNNPGAGDHHRREGKA